MKRIKTFSGSIYEINEETKQIRRLFGKAKPTDRQGKDGAWKGYDHISTPEIGHRLVIFWDPATNPLLAETVALFGSGISGTPMTETSPITSIENGDDLN